MTNGGRPAAAPAERSLASPETMTALRTCVHCGICLPQCPTYRVLGEEMDSPRGRLYLMRAAGEGRIGLTATVIRHLDLCLGCRACESACPAGVPFGSLLETARGEIERRGRPWRRRLLDAAMAAVFPHPGRLGTLLGAARAYRASGLQHLVRASRVLGLSPRLAALDALLDAVPDRAPVPAFVAARGKARGRAAVLLGCVQRHLFADVNRDTARLLALAGWNVVVPPAQGCCGALDLHAGRVDAFRARARALAAAMPPDVDIVVVNAAGCGSAMKTYAHWVDDGVVRRLAERTRDVSEVLAAADLPLGRIAATVTYHDACHLAHGQKIRAEPRALLRRIPGLRLVDLPDSDMCCGSAGVYNVTEPEMADHLLAMKVDSIAATGARVVVAGNPGCLLQIAKGCRERGLGVEVLHPVTLLARAVTVTS